MSVYAQGGDPLAWATGSAAFQTTADETDQATSQDTASSQEAPQTATVTTDDVYAALASLQFDGTDVSLEKDAAHVVLSADGIWVEEASADAPTDMALACAQRSAALATWASEQDVGIPSVTWICEDGSGAVRMAVTMPTDSAPTTGGLATLLWQQPATASLATRMPSWTPVTSRSLRAPHPHFRMARPSPSTPL